VIPAFSIERTQVILYELNNLIEGGKIPSVPVFLDSPLGLKVTEIYNRFKKDFNPEVQKEIKSGDDIFNFPKLNITHGSRDSQDIVNTANPKIIIAGSGMSTGGRVTWHEMHFLPDPKSTVLLMGYQAVGTLGRRIEDKPKSVEINGSMIPIRARIEMISGYSSHKDSDNLVEMVSECAQSMEVNPDARSGRGADRKRRLKVFVVMGEPKASTYLVQRLREELDVDATYPECGKIYLL
jgi:metallo-beta-lactamase family protein